MKFEIVLENSIILWPVCCRSCFPDAIISRVLLCGLEDFHTHSHSDVLVTAVDPNVPKMASVIGILSHLAVQHCDCLERAMWSVVEVRTKPSRGTFMTNNKNNGWNVYLANCIFVKMFIHGGKNQICPVASCRSMIGRFSYSRNRQQWTYTAYRNATIVTVASHFNYQTPIGKCT